MFQNKERGLYSFDPSTGTYGKADETYTSDAVPDARKHQKMTLNYCDSYFLNELFHKMGCDKVIDSIQYRNRDSLYAMAEYYLLCQKANEHKQIWYDDSHARVICPNANLTSQRISDFLAPLGKPETRTKYFDSHVKLVMKQCDDPAILMDSTGLPNDIHFPLTAVSNHNRQISKEVRMTTLVQRNSGYPIFSVSHRVILLIFQQ